MRRFAVVALPLGLALLSACSQQAAPDTATASAESSAPAEPSAPAAPDRPALVLSDATVQLPAVPGRPAVAYFTLTPGPDATGKLVAVSVTHFARAELHESRMEGGAMTMSPVASLPITPGIPIVFKPAGLHVMLFDADGAIKPGDTTQLTARLDNGSTISTTAKVTAQGGDMGGMKM
jgi:copper(I)-binding protein